MELPRINLILQKDCQLHKSNPIIVGVSGGPDSLCLVDLLVSLGYPVVVAHFNHHLRPEADDEASRVAGFARERSLPFQPGDLDVAALAAAEHLSIEEAARKARYRFLFDCARMQNSQAVAVGHTADDQVETVLMHLLRGAGLAGLRGMSFRAFLRDWDPVIPIIRPLLDTWRSEIMDYCAARGLEPVFDPSNADTTFYRNRLRHDLLPVLETYNPRIKDAFLRMSHTLAGDYQVLQDAADQAWEAVLVSQTQTAIGLDFRKLKNTPAGMQRILFRRAIDGLRPALRNIDYADVERALNFIELTPRSGKSDLASGLRLFLEGDCLYLAASETDLPTLASPLLEPGYVQRIDSPGGTALADGWILEAQLVDLQQAGLDLSCLSENPYRVWLDAEKLHFPLEIRGRRPGDRFIPYGLPGHPVKLADYFINVKLPRRLRDCWPLVCSSGQIAWIPGYRAAHPFIVEPSTHLAIRLDLYKGPAEGRQPENTQEA